MCTFLDRSQIVRDRKLKCNAKTGDIPHGRNECFVPFFAHDAVHPSAVGHAIAKDLVVHALASAGEGSCAAGDGDDDDARRRDVLPLTTFVADDFRDLEARGDFLVVYDVARVFSRWDDLRPVPGSAKGFERYADDGLKQRPGWIATDPAGGSAITFALDLPPGGCYVVYLAILRSYKGMGTLDARVVDYGGSGKDEKARKKVTTKTIDGLWDAPISVWSDVQITADDDPGCTGYCEVIIATNPKMEGREGNKVKLLTLSARKCSVT